MTKEDDLNFDVDALTQLQVLEGQFILIGKNLYASFLKRINEGKNLFAFEQTLLEIDDFFKEHSDLELNAYHLKFKQEVSSILQSIRYLEANTQNLYIADDIKSFIKKCTFVVDDAENKRMQNEKLKEYDLTLKLYEDFLDQSASEELVDSGIRQMALDTNKELDDLEETLKSTGDSDQIEAEEPKKKYKKSKKKPMTKHMYKKIEKYAFEYQRVCNEIISKYKTDKNSISGRDLKKLYDVASRIKNYEVSHENIRFSEDSKYLLESVAEILDAFDKYKEKYFECFNETSCMQYLVNYPNDTEIDKKFQISKLKALDKILARANDYVEEFLENGFEGKNLSELEEKSKTKKFHLNKRHALVGGTIVVVGAIAIASVPHFSNKKNNSESNTASVETVTEIESLESFYQNSTESVSSEIQEEPQETEIESISEVVLESEEPASIVDIQESEETKEPEETVSPATQESLESESLVEVAEESEEASLEETTDQEKTNFGDKISWINQKAEPVASQLDDTYQAIDKIVNKSENSLLKSYWNFTTNPNPVDAIKNLFSKGESSTIDVKTEAESEVLESEVETTTPSETENTTENNGAAEEKNEVSTKRTLTSQTSSKVEEDNQSAADQEVVKESLNENQTQDVQNDGFINIGEHFNVLPGAQIYENAYDMANQSHEKNPYFGAEADRECYAVVFMDNEGNIECVKDKETVEAYRTDGSYTYIGNLAINQYSRDKSENVNAYEGFYSSNDTQEVGVSRTLKP